MLYVSKIHPISLYTGDDTIPVHKNLLYLISLLTNDDLYQNLIMIRSGLDESYSGPNMSFWSLINYKFPASCLFL